MEQAARKNIIQQLQKEILALQGFKASCGNDKLNTGLGLIERSFPNYSFPTGAIHELLSYSEPDAAATNGFLAALLSRLMAKGARAIWISHKQHLFAAGMSAFNVMPDQLIFIEVQKEKDLLWATEEALKCDAIAAVITECSDLSFEASRRLQLAVEHSRVTGFIHRYMPKKNNPTASVTRWRITCLPSMTDENIPGLGFPVWNIELQKVRNGTPGTWQLGWTTEGFNHIQVNKPIAQPYLRKVV